MISGRRRGSNMNAGGDIMLMLADLALRDDLDEVIGELESRVISMLEESLQPCGDDAVERAMTWITGPHSWGFAPEVELAAKVASGRKKIVDDEELLMLKIKLQYAYRLIDFLTNPTTRIAEFKKILCL